MTKDIEKLVDLYKLLISGNYVYDNTVSLIDFIRILRVIKFNKRIYKCLKKSHIELVSFLGIMEFLKNVNIIKLVRNIRIKVQNNEIFELIYKNPSKKIIFLKLVKKIPFQNYLVKKLTFSSKITLLELYKPKFELNARNFQIPCSLKSSIKRAVIISQKIYSKNQKAVFVGDDDLVSILCKFIIPELPISVIEIDGRITKLLKDIAKRHKFKDFNVFNLDFKDFHEIKQHIEPMFSVFHLDPPYEAKELQKFAINLSSMQDKFLVQIFLNGLYDPNCMAIINEFILKNKLILSDYYKSFNSYSFQSADSKYLKYTKKQLKFETDLKLKEKDIEKIEFFSDLYIIEKSLTEKDIDLEIKEVN
ncbi:MAG: bis-aminopropyl spermidine synthase family protein [Promethearchaeota archaeon]